MNRSLALKIFEGFSIQRWNDLVRPFELVEMDKAGEFIPFCTKMVFLKYYTPSEGNQLHFWGQADRIAYVKAINATLSDYLTEAIQLELEAE